MRERRLSGSERGAVAIDDDDDDQGTAGEAGTANGVVGPFFESAASTRPLARRPLSRPSRHLRGEGNKLPVAPTVSQRLTLN